MKGHSQIIFDLVPCLLNSGISEGLDAESGAVGDFKSMYDPNEGRAMKAPSDDFE